MTALLCQFLFTVAAGSFVGYGYFDYLPGGETGLARLASPLALVSTGAILSLVPLLLLIVPVALLRSKVLTWWVSPCFFAVVTLFIETDLVVYRLFRFHLNGMVFNLFTTRGGSDSFSFGEGTLRSMALAIAVTVAAHLGLSLVVLRPYLSPGRLSAVRSVVRLALALLFLIIVADKALYAWGDITNRAELTRARHLLPLYRPVVARTFARVTLGIEPVPRDEMVRVPRGGSLVYPRAPIRIPEGGPRPDIVIIAIEGLRQDMLNESAMPFLSRWASSNLTCALHYSGGNASRFGVFSLLYGLYGTYWQKVLAERQPPVLVTELRRLGYSFRVLSGTDLHYPEFRSTAFIDIPSAITDSWPGERVDRDRLQTDAAEEFLRTQTGPSFLFVFYDASHQPYLYPPEHAVFRPALDRKALNYIKMAGDRGQRARMVFNRYRNSVHYIDAQLERLIGTLETTGRLEHALVFVTGDHGEEFNEHGHIGHNSTFDQWQVRTPLVVHIPGGSPRRIERMTTHFDVVPTIFTFMGATNPVPDYSQGTPLTSDTGPGWVVAAMWDKAAFIDRDRTIVFGTEATNLDLEIRDSDYQTVNEGLGDRAAALHTMMRRMGEFSR